MLKKYPLHPVLFAVYPVLFLYANNISMLELNHIFIPMTISVIAALLIWTILNLIIRNKYKSSIITSVFFILFFSYGHLVTVSGNILENAIGLNADLYVSINLILILIIISYLVIKYLKNILLINSILNFIALILLVYPVFTIVQAENIYAKSPKYEPDQFVNDENIKVTDKSKKPDIYYIILDGYGRDDILKSVYGYDNEAFLKELENRGFFIARKSRANYAQTLLSLSSSLNMNYLESSEDSFDIEIYRRELSSTISQSHVASILKGLGYKFVTFATGYSGTEVKNSDLYITPSFSLDEFQFMLLGTTPLYRLLEIIPNNSPIYLQRQRILFSIEKISKVKIRESPIFLFAHIIAPHPPFVLSPNKELMEQQKNRLFSFLDGSHYHSFIDIFMKEYKENYISQLKELNKLILVMLDEILAENKQNKIIILQSDHGPGLLLNWENPTPNTFKERLPILNAFHFPDIEKVPVNELITPVNTFRIILNQYFNGNYEILDNKSYFSTWLRPQKFIDVDRYY